MVTGPGPRPRTPGTISSAPNAVAPVDISIPRWLAVLAAGSAWSNRQAPARSLSIRSAVQGGGSASELGITPSPTSADERACAAAEDSTATVWPDCCRSLSAATSASSTDPLAAGRSSSNAGRNSPRSSISTEIKSRSARRASASRAEASGSCVGPTSASTPPSDPRAESPGTGCQPTRSSRFSNSSWARFQAGETSSSSAPRTRTTRSVLVHSTLGSTSSASTRSSRRRLSGRNGSTAWWSANPCPSVAANDSRVVRMAFGAATIAAVEAMLRLRVAAPTAAPPIACTKAARRVWRSAGPSGGGTGRDGG